jgi:hypothetical protein
MGEQATFPTPKDGDCGGGSCELFEGGDSGEDDSCMCNTTVIDRAVFDSKPTREEILSDLHIGSIQPDLTKYDVASGGNTAGGE